MTLRGSMRPILFAALLALAPALVRAQATSAVPVKLAEGVYRELSAGQ